MEDEDLFGTAVQLAARICGHAEAGQILAPIVVRELAWGVWWRRRMKARSARKVVLREAQDERLEQGQDDGAWGLSQARGAKPDGRRVRYPIDRGPPDVR